MVANQLHELAPARKGWNNSENKVASLSLLHLFEAARDNTFKISDKEAYGVYLNYMYRIFVYILFYRKVVTIM